jgi:hypothetical protein
MQLATTETSSGQHVLMKDQSRIKKAIRRTTIIVNSRDRNFLNYPNSNQFRYSLRRPLTNVLSITLTNGVIPSYIYNIQPAWASFTLYEYPVPYARPSNTANVTLTTGFYTEAELLVELATQLNAVPNRNNTYSVSQTVINGRNTRFIQIIGSSSGSAANILNHAVDFKIVTFILPFELIGIWIGVIIAHRVRVERLKKVAAWLCILVGVYMTVNSLV